jgi:hypothetical protein
MKRVLRFAAVNILGLALLAAGTPLSAAPQDGNGRWQRNGDTRSQSAWTQPQRGEYNHGSDQRGDYNRGNDRERSYRDQHYRYDDHSGWRDHDAGRVYAAPNYYANGYGYPASGYYYSDGHAGRTAAIIGGTAAAGALVGAAAGHGEGAAIGAVVGGIAGVIASQAVNHHDHH